jgi:hypothetical protein
MAGARFTWTHVDTVTDLHSDGLRANELAKSGEAWPDTPEGNRLFRAWLAGTIATIANLGPNRISQTTPVEGGGVPAWIVMPQPSTDNAAAFDFQQQMAYAIGALAWAGQGKTGGDPSSFMLTTDVTIATKDGDPPRILSPGAPPPTPSRTFTIPSLGDVPVLTARLDTGIIPAIPIVTGIVIVSCVAILAAAGAWITSQGSEVAAVAVQQKGKTTVAVQAITSAAELVEAHQQREQQEGRSIPYDQGELELLKTLQGTIAQTSGWQAPPLRSVPDVRGASTAIGAGLGAGQLLFWGLLGYAALEYGKKHA